MGGVRRGRAGRAGAQRVCGRRRRAAPDRISACPPACLPAILPLQVFKGGLSRTGMEEGEQFRYFGQQDLRDLFRLEPSECEASATQRELHAMHAGQRRETPQLAAHLRFLATLDCFAGALRWRRAGVAVPELGSISRMSLNLLHPFARPAGVSDHDLLFSKKEREASAAPAGTRPTATRGAVGGSGVGSAAGRQAARPGGGGTGLFGKTAAQGWSGGGSELSDMFARAVTVSGSSSSSAAAVAAAALPPGSLSFGSAATAAPFRPPRSLSSSSSKDPLQ